MALQTWAEKQDIRLEYIQPGKPQQNAYIERFWGIVFGTARVLLAAANLPPTFHPFALQTVVRRTWQAFSFTEASRTWTLTRSTTRCSSSSPHTP